jgi:hypothetical protein
MYHFKYKPISSIRIKHPFYKDGVSKDFLIEPIAETERLLKSYDLIAKSQDGQVILFQKYNSDDTPFQEIDGAIDLFFTVKVQTNIMNITAPIKTEEGKEVKRFWLSNFKPSEEDENSITYKSILTKDTHLSIEDKLPADLFRYLKGELVEEGPPNTLLQIEIAKNIWKQLQTKFPDEQQLKAEFNKLIKETAIGKTLLRLENQRNIWGIIHLKFPANEQESDFTISLTSKESQWYYLLQEPIGSNFNNDTLQLNYSKENSLYPPDVQFREITDLENNNRLKEKVTLLENMSTIKKVHVFTSNNSLGLLESSPPNIELKKGNEVLNKQLPIPTRNQLETIINYPL